MAHTYTNLLIHSVFSTKHREKTITAEHQSQLWPYLGGIARTNKMHALAIGGIEDHVHLLLSIPSWMAVAKAIQLIKGGSSKWAHENGFKELHWQEAYGAFTVGASQVDDTVAYINTQAEHHQKYSFEDEFRAFLKKNGIEWDEEYIFA